MTIDYGTLNASVQEKVEADQDFQDSIASLPDEEKETALQAKKTELFDKELADLSEKAEKATKAEELANNYKTRAEKAEGKLKGKNGEVETPKTTGDLTPLDTIALMKADVHEDDIADIVDYAKFKNISVSEALKSSVVKTTLSEKSETRKTADATNTGNARRGAAKVSGETLVENLKEGKVPDSKEENEDLFWARRGGKKE